MLAQVHDRVRAESGVQPVVGGQVVVAGRQVGVVVDRDRVVPEAAGRLHHQHQVARLYCGDDDFAVGIVAAIHEKLPGWRAPVLLDGVGELGGQGREPGAVVGGGHPDRVAGQLPLGEPVGVLPAPLDQGVDQGVAVVRLDAGQVADAVAVRAHGPQQGDRAGRGVQPHRVADAGVLGGIGREHQGHPFVGRADVAQPGMPHRQPRHPGASLGVGDVGDQAVVVNLLEGERDRDDAAVEFRYRDLTGHI